MRRFSRTFFYRSSAEAFAKELEANGAKNIEIWSGKDGFGQTTHTVKWDEKRRTRQ